MNTFGTDPAGRTHPPRESDHGRTGDTLDVGASVQAMLDEKAAAAGRMTEAEVLRTPLGRFLGLCVLLAALAVIPLTFGRDLNRPTLLDIVSDCVIWLVFVVEYLLMLWLVRDRREYVRRRWLNVAVIVMTFPLVPAILALGGALRLTRVVRVVRVIRVLAVFAMALQSLRAVMRRPGVAYLAVLTIFLMFSSVGFMLQLEPEIIKHSLGHGLWWAIVTASTVGYGDIAPSTLGGRIVAVVLMVTGIGFMSTLSASIAAYFVGRDERQEIQDLHSRLERMEEALERIESHLTRDTQVEPGGSEGREGTITAPADSSPGSHGMKPPDAIGAGRSGTRE